MSISGLHSLGVGEIGARFKTFGLSKLNRFLCPRWDFGAPVDKHAPRGAYKVAVHDTKELIFSTT